MKTYVATIVASLLLGACGSISGLGGKQEFSCKAPEGVSCESLSGVYANSIANNLPSQRPSHKGNSKASQDAEKQAPPPLLPPGPAPQQLISPADLATMESGTPIRQPPRILRVWVAPWEDELGDLHDQKYVYVVVNGGKWMIEANRQTVRDQFRPVFPLSVTPPGERKGVDRRPKDDNANSTRPLGIPSE